MSADTMSVQTHRVVPSRRPVHPTTASVPLLEDGETAPVWMRVTGAVLLAAGGALTGAVLGWPGDAPEIALVVPGLVGMVVGLLLLVARVGVTVTEQDVVLHFRPLPPRRIARRRIIAARRVEADASTYGGIGLRHHRGVRALLLTPGPGVEFTDDRGGVTFVRTGRPEDASRLLTGARPRPTDELRNGRDRLG